jgi:YD repeat-containing protein
MQRVNWVGFGLLMVGLGAAVTSCSSDDNALPASANAGGTGKQAGVGGQSSDAGNGGSALSGGTSSNIGVGGSAGVVAIAGPTGQCPPWPKERLFPYVGLHFYGPNPGPCTRTYALKSGADSTMSGIYDFTYDASGHATRMAKQDGTDITTYTLDQGLIVGSVETVKSSDSTVATTATYFYGSNSVGYSVGVAGSASPLYTYTYNLDGLGYPLYIASGLPPASSSVPVLYVYQYDGCRINSRTAYLADDTVDSTNSSEYAYDGAGRIVTITTGLSTETFDYSCW